MSEIPDAGQSGSTAWPIEIRLSADKRALEIGFDNGRSYRLSAEYLRIASPSAEVQGHGPGQRKTVPGKRDITITGVEPVGNYAVRLVFDDMHQTGIYGWGYLHDLGEREPELWQDYLDRMREAGLSRDPPTRRA